jgi:hypothetical protein
VIVAATEIDAGSGRLAFNRIEPESGLVFARPSSVVRVGIYSGPNADPARRLWRRPKLVMQRKAWLEADATIPLRRRSALVTPGPVRFEADAATIPLRPEPVTPGTVRFEADAAAISLRPMPVVSKGVRPRPEAAPVPLRLSPVIAVFAAATRVPSRFKPGVRVIARQHSAQLIMSYLSGRGTPRIRPTVKRIAELVVGRPLWP